MVRRLKTGSLSSSSELWGIGAVPGCLVSGIGQLGWVRSSPEHKNPISEVVEGVVSSAAQYNSVRLSQGLKAG